MFEGMTVGLWVLLGFGFLILCLVAGFVDAWLEQRKINREDEERDRFLKQLRGNDNLP